MAKRGRGHYALPKEDENAISRDLVSEICEKEKGNSINETCLMSKYQISLQTAQAVLERLNVKSNIL